MHYDGRAVHQKQASQHAMANKVTNLLKRQLHKTIKT